jgi:hypothetical protein
VDHTFSTHVLTERIPSRGNFVLALLAGLAAAVVGAVIWMGVMLTTGWDMGSVVLTLGVGLMVGLAIRINGNGSNFIYGMLGIAFTLLSCLVGEIGVALQSATTSQLDLYAVIMHIDLISLISSIVSHTSLMMLAAYVVGSILAYKLSIRK